MKVSFQKAFWRFLCRMTGMFLKIAWFWDVYPTFLCGSRYLNFWGPTKYSIVAPFGLIHEIPAIPTFTLWYNDGRRPWNSRGKVDVWCPTCVNKRQQTTSWRQIESKVCFFRSSQYPDFKPVRRMVLLFSSGRCNFGVLYIPTALHNTFCLTLQCRLSACRALGEPNATVTAEQRNMQFNAFDNRQLFLHQQAVYVNQDTGPVVASEAREAIAGLENVAQMRMAQQRLRMAESSIAGQAQEAYQRRVGDLAQLQQAEAKEHKRAVEVTSRAPLGTDHERWDASRGSPAINFGEKNGWDRQFDQWTQGHERKARLATWRQSQDSDDVYIDVMAPLLAKCAMRGVL